MPKFNNTYESGNYAEISQTNPLRWANLFKEEDGSLTFQSKKWKCKDFMNEVVSYYQGNKTSIYGYNAGLMKFNDDGVWLTLYHVTDKEVFKKNVGSISKLPGYKAIKLEQLEGEHEFLLFIPKWYFSNTYSISVLTYLIRAANCKDEVLDWYTHPTKPIDNPSPKHHDAIVKRGFTPPIDGFWYYVGKEYTNLKQPMTGTVHNCGMDAWMTACAKEGIV